MTVLKPMLKLALLPLLLLLILAQWVGIFLTTFSTILTNLLAGLFFFVALTSWVMKLADGGEVLKMLITAFVVFALPYIAMSIMCKLETMIYASGDETSSVFTLNPALQKQLDTLASQHPEVCQRKARGEAGGVTYQVRGAALAIQPVRVS